MDQVTSLNQSLAIPFIIIGLVLFLLISSKLLIFPRGSHRSNASTSKEDLKVIISGAMGNGKTHLWSRLVYGTDHIETVTSMVENKITLDFLGRTNLDEKQNHDFNRSPICLIDTPGHPRLICRSLARNLPHSKGVIFVIDAQVGLSGKGLRDTSGALELVLSLLQLLHHQKPHHPLPKLLICISNRNQKGTLSKSVMIEKTRASLIKELNRRKLNSNETSKSGTGVRKSRLESLDEIPSSELNSFFDIIKRFFNLGQSSNLIGQDESSPIQLPEEQAEVTKLLEDEEDNLTPDHKLLDSLDRYEKLSGHSLNWIVSGTENEDEIDLIKRWFIDL